LGKWSEKIRGLLDRDGIGWHASVAPSQATEEADERRCNQRIEHYGWARFSAEGVAGEGLVTNLSHGGALVERASETLAAGTKFTLRLKPAGGFDTVELDAEVVREIAGGFAFRFSKVDDAALAVLRKVISGGTTEA
jgi:hypothetical protein